MIFSHSTQAFLLVLALFNLVHLQNPSPEREPTRAEAFQDYPKAGGVSIKCAFPLLSKLEEQARLIQQRYPAALEKLRSQQSQRHLLNISY